MANQTKAEKRARKARRAALRTLHDVAENGDTSTARLQAAIELKVWGTGYASRRDA